LPDLVGLTRSQVSERLEQLRAGSNVAFTWVFDEITTGIAADNGLVQAMVPGPGTVVDEDDVIVITVWRFQPPA
jgi:beta-lactam-binding protein with PASTA domain